MVNVNIQSDIQRLLNKQLDIYARHNCILCYQRAFIKLYKEVGVGIDTLIGKYEPIMILAVINFMKWWQERKMENGLFDLPFVYDIGSPFE